MKAAARLIESYQTTFGEWYPDPDGDPPIAGVMAMISKRLDVADYNQIARQWPVSDALVYLEQSRVQASFDDLADSV